MSLILRKQCQQTLNSVGLDEHHVSVDQNKYLSVNCECGSPLFKVFGIRFTRTTPSKDEITYAAELFKAYITKHKTTIKAFLKKQTKFNALPAVEMPERITNGGYLRYRYALQEDVTFTFKLSDDNTVSSVDRLENVTIDNLAKVTFNKKQFDADIKTLVAHLQYQKDSASFNNIQALMDSCEV